MPVWNSRGLRGSALEELINLTNSKYADQGLALIQKIPTPITPINIDPESRHITLAYFDQKSTVDYIGAIQGIPICFDAKECATDSFPIHNIHEHQMNFMKSFRKQKGLAFLIIYFKKHDLYYFLTYEQLEPFWERAAANGPKSFKLSELEEGWEIKESKGIPIHYLETVQKYLDNISE